MYCAVAVTPVCVWLTRVVMLVQNGVLLQPRGGDASTSGRTQQQGQGQKGHVAYVGAEPTHAELLRPRVADGSAPASRYTCMCSNGRMQILSGLCT